MKKLVLLLALVLASVCAHAQVLHVDGAEVTERPAYINLRVSQMPMGKKFFASVWYGQAITATKPGAVHTPTGEVLKLESEIAFLNLFASLGYRVVTTDRRINGLDFYDILMERK